MTKGFHTILQLPFEGSVIVEHETKKKAEEHYQKEVKDVETGNLIGAALVRIEVILEKGDWR